MPDAEIYKGRANAAHRHALQYADGSPERDLYLEIAQEWRKLAEQVNAAKRQGDQADHRGAHEDS